MGDEIETFLVRFGMGIVILILLAVLWCFARKYFCRRRKKLLVCTCAKGGTPSFQPHHSEGTVSEMVPVQNAHHLNAAPLDLPDSGDSNMGQWVAGPELVLLTM